jgi:hypothetical protein
VVYVKSPEDLVAIENKNKKLSIFPLLELNTPCFEETSDP